jgi:GNAT superfamily N-acetyltransferase
MLEPLLVWYQDRETARLVDGPDAEPYDLDRLQAMLRYMSQHGELYLIERLTQDRGWIPIGDACLQPRAMPIVLAPDHRGQGIGYAVGKALIERARELGWQLVEVSDIYDYNVTSRRMYESLGFRVVGDTKHGHRYTLPLS